MSDDEELYNRYYRRSKRYFKENNLEKSLEALRNAYKIKPSESLQTKMNKIESILEDNGGENEEIKFKQDENKLLIEGRFYVDKASHELLYEYQKEGVLWLLKLFERRRGGILADDMGLGKTVQVIFFLRELFESDLIKSALIVMPKSLLINWEREFEKWGKGLSVLMYTGNERERNLNKVRRRGGILLTTYGTIMSSWDDLNADSSFKWNVLALDEGHKIKNPSSKTFKTINAIRADMRLVMTGTAVQNKLKELWALFDFTHQGSLLGNYPTFLIDFERPITTSRNKDASETEKIYGDEIAKSLKKLIKDFFLRRTKEEVTKLIDGKVGKNAPSLKRKNDLIIWVKMTNVQIHFYQKFLELDEIKQLLTMSEKRSPLVELNVLKKICDHPRLLRSEHCAEMGMTFAERIEDVDLTMLQEESGKMQFLLILLNKLVSENHKCLVFSQSKIILNIIQRILTSNNIKLLRLDGDVLKPTDRQNIVDTFNNESEYRVLLLTSQVGGVGLTLTGADRAVIYDLNWNPSIDAQAVDRLYRIGQLQNVVVYRLITCGSIEEKIYRRQIFKDSVNRQTTGVHKTDKNPFRYFTQGELLELFILDNPRVSKTQIQLEKMHAQFRRSDEDLDDHILWLKNQKIFGITDHDLMFSQEEEMVDVDDETREILLTHKEQAECRLMKESKANATVEEGQLRLLMSKMSLNDNKSKIKEKVAAENMFIPSKADIKHAVNHFQPMKQNKIPSYFEPIKTKQFIDLSNDDLRFNKSIVPVVPDNVVDKDDIITIESDTSESETEDYKVNVSKDRRKKYETSYTSSKGANDSESNSSEDDDEESNHINENSDNESIKSVNSAVLEVKNYLKGFKKDVSDDSAKNEEFESDDYLNVKSIKKEKKRNRFISDDEDDITEELPRESAQVKLKDEENTSKIVKKSFKRNPSIERYKLMEESFKSQKAEESSESQEGLEESFESKKDEEESFESKKDEEESLESQKDEEESLESQKDEEKSFESKKDEEESSEIQEVLEQSFESQKVEEESFESQDADEESFYEQDILDESILE